MGEQNASGQTLHRVPVDTIVNDLKRISPVGRLSRYAKTWWRERGGPEGVTKAYLRSVDEIHAAIPPGVTEEVFRNKIRPLLVAQAKAAGYAATVGEVILSALTTAWFVQGGRHVAQRYETTTRESVDAVIEQDVFQEGLDQYRNQPSQFDQSPPATVIDSQTQAIVPNDSGFRRSEADDMVDAMRLGGRIVSTVGGALIRGSGTLAGIAAGAAVLERGPVHAVAKLSAKAEGAAGAAVVKIVDRIVSGRQRRAIE